MPNQSIWLVGGDRRAVLLSQWLDRDGEQVSTYALDQAGVPGKRKYLAGIGETDRVILPVPAVRGEMVNAPLSDRPLPLTQLFAALSPGQRLYAGQVTPVLEHLARERKVELVDYLAREELAAANALSTAEGAVQLAMERLAVTLHGSAVLVLGFGRIGKALLLQLKGLGAQVRVAARKAEDLTWVSILGGIPVPFPERGMALEGVSVVFNTVPALVMGKDFLRRLPKGCPVVDLASAPGGANRAVAEELGIPLELFPGLPGRYAPESAARAIYETLKQIWAEEET